MSPPKQRSPAARQGGWVELARSLGSALGSLLGVGRRAASVDKTDLRRMMQIRRRLVLQVAELEAELERLHTNITNNPDAAPRASLDALVRRARQARERVQEKRDELGRVERHLARERWLGSQSRRVASGLSKSSTLRRRRPARAKQGAGRRTSLVQRVLAKSVFPSRSEKVALQKLGEGLSHANAEVRHETCLKLAELDLPAARKLLLLALDDRSERVQLAALNGLAGTRGQRVAQAFRRFLRHENPACRLAAIRGLAGTSRRALSNAELRRALADDDSAVRSFALKVLAWRREEGTLEAATTPVLGVALHDHDEGVRRAAVEALAADASDRSVSGLIRAIADDDQAVRETALAALRDIVGDEVGEIGAGMQPVERSAALKQWWKSARVDFALRRRSVGPREAVQRGSSAAPPPHSGKMARDREREEALSSAPPREPTGSTPAAPQERASSPPPAEAGAMNPLDGVIDDAATSIAFTDELDTLSGVAKLDDVAVASSDAAADFESVLGGDADVAAGLGLESGEEQGDFESVLGEDAEGASAAATESSGEGGDFESVFGDDEKAEKHEKPAEKSSDEDESAEGEEYENIFGSEE